MSIRTPFEKTHLCACTPVAESQPIVVVGNLKQWLDTNCLSLNVLKTKRLFTGTRQKKISLLPSEPHIYLDGHSIERVHSYKCLGVQVDETLSWEGHVFKVVGKVAKVLDALRRLRQICPQSHN